jgi:hypothetical protein
METETHQNFKSIYIIVGLVVLVGVGYFFFTSGHDTNPPEKVITPSGYPAGSKISVYKNLPANFPGEVLLEGKEINNAGTLTTPNKPTITTVSYVSDKSVLELMPMYLNNFTNLGWNIDSKSTLKGIGKIQAEKDGGKINLIISPFLKKTALTFQYEK